MFRPIKKRMFFYGSFFLVLTIVACNGYVAQFDLWQSPVPGLTLTLPQPLVRSSLTAVTFNKILVDSDALTPAGTGAWVSNVDVNRIGGTYQYLVGNSTPNSLTGPITATTKSKIILAHQIRTDSAALDISVDGMVLSTIPQGAVDIGWTIQEVGIISSGVHTLAIATSDPGTKFAYADGFIILPVLNLAAGEKQKGWFEQDHPQIYLQGAWGLIAAPILFPFSVSSTTGTGAVVSANTGDNVLFFVETDSASKLRIYAQTAADQGIMNVTIDGVPQTAFDQYSATTSYKAFAEFSIAAGDHLVSLSVSGSKNAASSAFGVYLDAVELKVSTPSDEDRALAMVDSIVNNIDATDGGARISYDAELYNQDNDSGYSMMALALAVARWNIPEHAAALKRNIQWFSNIVQTDGVWYWGYCKEGNADCPRSYIVPASGADCIAGYCPSVNSYYTGLAPSITALRSIDAPQSFPAVGLAIYASLFPDDSAFINSVKPKILSGIDALIENNYDISNGYFYSSYQYKNGLGWLLYEVQYSAGQCDVYMGLKAAYSLTGNKKYKTYADHIKENFDQDYFDASRNLYSIGLFGPMGGTKTMDTTVNYGFAQGWCAWVFGESGLARATDVMTTVKTWIQPDTFSVLPPPTTDPETSQSAWLLMGLTGINSDAAIQNNLKARFRNYQFEYHPDLEYGTGGEKFSDAIPYLYTSNAAWAFIALTQQPSPVTWWK
ncbi:MAG: hypothetical protein A2622_04615 [Bdellovibrionales bacterium RIFCSPHIGHO2_01_FULL_40_29]|nr:MAG: hypothetical protein A2622_04615 [Bdellovibrionales bacterium RIFCSPHIGHO2_01_FULL_40_29]OFZ34784.1 MAG: hypothetical protein A3D17_10760 [Bdellovibrionales bacterium RIFCSPHIGHO2_02_FULL_40_15]